MPPLQDITHRFVSPLPPSSPALSYIDEFRDDEYHNKTEPSSAFLALSSSSKPYPRRQISDEKSDNEFVLDKENKENLPPFELEDEFDQPLPGHDGPGPSTFAAAVPFFSTPKKSESKPENSPPSSDPFGFIAVERKLKLERNKAKRPISGRAEPEPEPEPKRQKLGSRPTPAADIPSRVTPARKTLRSTKLKTQTPVVRHVVDPRTLSPPAASPFHDQGRKRRRDTLSFDDDGNPFVDSPQASTPSPSKRHRSPPQSRTVLLDKENDADNELISPSPTVQKKRVPETKNKRKRARIAEDDDVGNQTLSAFAHDPQLLANILQSRLPKRRVRQTETVAKPTKRSGSQRKKRGEETVDEDEQESKNDEKEGRRRSSRLAVRESRQTCSSKDGNEEIKKTTSKKPTRKTKGKENSDKKPKTASSSIGATTRATRSKKKPASKAKRDEPQDDQKSDGKWERERAARRAYFEKLDSYELETESIYVI